MQPAPSAPEPSTPAAATPRGTPPGRSRATSPRASTRGEVGRVVIHTEPQDARVLVNGEATPYRSPVNFALAPGRYQITVERSGFASQTQEVLVRENQMVQLTLDLEPND
ncbi:MAG: PEGA domain-containing protein [Candidatus Acidoferrales bacterium]